MIIINSKGTIEMKLLIIEDEEDLANALAAGFRKKDYVVDIATGRTGRAGACVHQQLRPYYLDLNLPGMDGLEILEKVREYDLKQKVLILSARSDYGQRIEGLDLGANDYLVKPFDFGELEARVRSLLRRSFTKTMSCCLLTGSGWIHARTGFLPTRTNRLTSPPKNMPYWNTCF